MAVTSLKWERQPVFHAGRTFFSWNMLLRLLPLLFLGVTATLQHPATPSTLPTRSGAASGTPSGAALENIQGSFLDVAYDGRLKYANPASKSFSCADWGVKLREWHALGIRLVIFQAVHDSRFGAFYTSALPFMAPWPGACADVVEAVLAAADGLPGMRVLLSAEYTGTEADPVTNATVMAGRLAIMAELAATHVPRHAPSFGGWYFSAEAYLTPYFVDDFWGYIGNLTTAARRATPGALILISPYNTRDAVADATFVAQLQRLGALGVDVIAYQDEVGCVRDELPLATVCGAWRTLREAHDLAGPGAPALWANVESFTWEGLPNNVTSALIPAPLPRLLAQLRCAAAARVDRVITFTVQAQYEVAGSPAPWGPPSGDAVRLRAEYVDALFAPHSPAAALRAAAIAQGAVAHAGVGARVSAVAPPPLPPGGGGGGGLPDALADGVTGAEDPYATSYVAFPLADGAGGCGRAVELVLALAAPTCFRALGLHALQVPASWWASGHTRVARNLSAALPAGAAFFAANASGGPWQPAATAARPAPWAQEAYDTRADVLVANAAAAPTCAQFVRVVVAPAAAPPGGGGGAAPPCPLLLLSEVFVLADAV